MNFLTENFKHLTTTPQNVEQLKKLVLQLAVQGKLTANWREENPNVEPACVLLDKIKAEKELLIKEGKIRREKPYSKVTVNEKVFELPIEWEWVRMVDYGITNTGTTPSKDNPEYFGNDYPFVKPAEISLRGIKYNTEDGLTEIGLQQGRLISENSVLMVCIGGSIGKSYFTDRDVSCNQQINTITPLLGISSEFLHYFLQSDYFQKTVWLNASGATTPIVNKGKWEQIAIPMPPIDEQNEIVSTVEKLFAEIVQLHNLAQKKITLRENAAKALFGKINNQVNGEDIQQTWQQLTTNLKTLTQSKDSVKQLRQSILQLAVQGKLTANWREENPNIEPSSVLLEKIKAKKEQLIKGGEIKKGAKQPPAKKQEISIPNSWLLVDLDDITQYITDGTHQTPSYVENGKMFLSAQNVKPFKFMPDNHKFVTEEAYLECIKNRKPEKGDILVGRVGSKGEAAVIDRDLEFAIYVSLGLIKTFQAFTSPDYIAIVMNSPYGVEYATGNMSSLGASAGNFNLGRIRSFPFPFPPFDEQKETVNKVNQLMILCDALEKKIEKRDSYQERIMQAVVKQAFTTIKE